MRHCLFVLLFFLFSGCSSLFYYPDSFLHFPPEKFGFKKEEFTLRAADGTKLVAWRFLARKKPYRGVILQFHGNAENISSHYTTLIWLTDLGFDLIIFDYRGYGGSQGEPSPAGTAQDGVAAIAFAQDFFHERSISEFRPPGARPKFIVYGQSLGGAIAGRALELTAPEVQASVDQVILEATFYSYKKIGAAVMRGSPITWLFSPLAYVLLSDGESSENYLKSENHPPLLVLHSKDDNVVPFALGENLFEIASPAKRFWKIDQLGHLETFWLSGGKPNVENRDRLLMEIGL